MIVSQDGNQFLSMILEWEKTQKIMREQDDRSVRSKMLVDGHDYIFFFMARDSVFGANENARSVFSIMKNPMEEPGYEDMSFSATNLTKAMAGEPKEEIFVYKDILTIKVIQKEDAYKHLMGRKVKAKGKDVGEKMRDIQRHRNDRDSKTKDGRINLNRDEDL
jgi:hypothetical protein